MQLKRGLGRGLESLLPPPIPETQTKQDNYRMAPLDKIIPNRLQPRTSFDEEKLRELADSIKEQGILQPLIVSQVGGGRYELIAGERRFRASRMAGLEEVPVVIRETDDEGMLALSIIENIQREDLNPIEEAMGCRELMEQFGCTQEDIAKKLGRSRAAVANSLRLLNLPRAVQDDVASGRYSAGHARAILAVEGIHEQLKLREKILSETPTVRDVEKLVQSYLSSAKGRSVKKREVSTQFNDIVESMKSSLGTKVSINTKKDGGKIVIEYYSVQDLDRIYKRIVR